MCRACELPPTAPCNCNYHGVYLSVDPCHCVPNLDWKLLTALSDLTDACPWDMDLSSFPWHRWSSAYLHSLHACSWCYTVLILPDSNSTLYCNKNQLHVLDSTLSTTGPATPCLIANPAVACNLCTERRSSNSIKVLSLI
jgi:hypothetical protein